MLNPDQTAAGAKWDRHVDALHGADADRSVERAEWKAHPAVHAHLDRLGGGPLESWITDHLPRPCRTAVSIGGGTADRELRMLADGHLERLVVVDVSARSLEQSRLIAHGLGVADRVEFVEGGYSPELLASLNRRNGHGPDAVLFLSSLHHLADASGVLADVREHLTPGGVVIGDEYVGPDRFAFDDRVRALASAYYRHVDAAVRSPWPELPVPDPVAVALDDPSEAIDSAAITDAVRRRFPNHRIATLGGGLAFPVWFGLDHDALHDTDLGWRAVEELLRTDLRLTRGGAIPTYFCRFVGRAPAERS